METTPALTIANRIFTIRGKQVMLDSDLSVIFTIQVKRINEQVNRNSKRFPDDFSFQLSHGEWQILKSQFATSSNSKGGKVKAPRVFTEHGIAMIAMLLRSELAIQMSIQIIQVFIQSRATHSILQSMGHRMTQLEQENNKTKSEIQSLWGAIRQHELPEYGIFFNNQIFDAYVFFSELIERAETSIILMDNYIDHTVLLQLAKRKKNVTATIYT